MAIRLRMIKGRYIALCAAKTKPEPGDVYLDDNMHHALSTKFAVDWVSEGRIHPQLEHSDDEIKRLMLEEESG